jgi:hydroxyisourate hydrolase
MSGITTHVLDTSLGLPAVGVSITLERSQNGSWMPVGRGETDADGRLRTLTGEGTIEPGLYRLTFDTGEYFRLSQRTAFFPEVTIVFDVHDGAQHFHVPLLLSNFGYSTYRGS